MLSPVSWRQLRTPLKELSEATRGGRAAEFEVHRQLPTTGAVQCSVRLCVGWLWFYGKGGDPETDGTQGPLCFEGSSPRDLASALLCLCEPYWVLSNSYVTRAGMYRNPSGPLDSFWPSSPRYLPQILSSSLLSTVPTPGQDHLFPGPGLGP